jgi:hypothetical protein
MRGAKGSGVLRRGFGTLRRFPISDAEVRDGVIGLAAC